MASGKYLSVLPTDDNKIAVRNSFAADWETFQAVDASLISDRMSTAKTIIAIKSLANGKFLSALDPVNLASNKMDIDEAECFIVYYGSSNRIALRLKGDSQFLTADDMSQKAWLSTGFLNDQKVFEVVSLDDKDELDRKRKLLEKVMARKMTRVVEETIIMNNTFVAYFNTSDDQQKVCSSAR